MQIHSYGRMKQDWLDGVKKVQFLKKTVSSCHKQSAKPPGSNSSPRLRFVLELRKLTHYLSKIFPVILPL